MQMTESSSTYTNTRSRACTPNHPGPHTLRKNCNLFVLPFGRSAFYDRQQTCPGPTAYFYWLAMQPPPVSNTKYSGVPENSLFIFLVFTIAKMSLQQLGHSICYKGLKTPENVWICQSLRSVLFKQTQPYGSSNPATAYLTHVVKSIWFPL